jgi:hypothetical protein
MLSTMAAAAKADCTHTGASCRSDAWDAIFNDESGVWIGAKRLGNVKEQVWERLAAGNKTRAEDMRREALPQPNRSQRKLKALWRAAGGNGASHPACI